jgi:hypothetical protein
LILTFNLASKISLQKSKKAHFKNPDAEMLDVREEVWE